jgi:2,3-diketo-5-methylthio-1-phosphopentane phosphatase
MDRDLRQGSRWSVLCDFDGTLTLLDTAEYILINHAEGDWKGVERLLESGSITIEQCMSLQFAMIHMSRDNMRAELDRVALPRPGLDELLEGCRREDARLKVTSAGLDFYIRHFLHRQGWGGIEVVAPEVTEHDHGVEFRFPPLRSPGAHNFKEDQVMAEQREGRRVAYLGDGTSDLWAAMAADRAFAVKGSRLDMLLDNEGKRHASFTDLREIVHQLFVDQRSGTKSREPEFMQ